MLKRIPAAVTFVVLSHPTANGDITDWRTHDVIAGTTGVVAEAGAELNGLDLRWANFREQNLTGADLSNSDLVGATFQFATLTDASFDDSLVAGASFLGTTDRGFTEEQFYSTRSYKEKKLAGTVLSQTNLSSWNLSGQDLSGASFLFADLRGINLAGANLSNAEFVLAKLTDANLTDAVVAAANFRRSPGLTKEQLYSTASYKNDDLRGISFEEVDLRGANFAGKNLRGADFTEADLTGVDFRDASVIGASFNRASGFNAQQLYSTRSYRDKDLSGVELSARGLALDLTGQNLTNARVGGAGTILTDAVVTGASLGSLTAEQLYSTASYKDKNLTGIWFYADEVTWDLSGQDLTGASFWGHRLEGIDLTDAIVNNTRMWNNFTNEQLYSTASYKSRDLRGIVLSGDWSGTDFTGQDLTDAELHANLDQADFKDAIVVRAEFGEADNLSEEQLYSTASYKERNLQGIDIRGSLSGWDFAGQDLEEASLSGPLVNIDFTGANLARASLRKTSSAIFDEANLLGASLSGELIADFSRANLMSADLGDVTFVRPKFDDTLYDQWTVFPAEFDLANSTGLVFVSSPVGDFDGDDGLTAADLDLLARRWYGVAMYGYAFQPMFDVNRDRTLDIADLRFWVEELKQTNFGDANLDGQVAFADFLSLSTHFGGTGGWAQGDFDGDGQVQFQDFLLLSSNFENASATTIPEPSPRLLVMGMMIAFCVSVRRGLSAAAWC